MSIEKMMFADIAGLDCELDKVLEIISECGCFHMENAAKVRMSSRDKNSARRENPYTSVVRMISETAAAGGIKLEYVECSDIHDSDADKIREEISSLRNRILKLRSEVKRAEENFAAHETALEQIKHIGENENGEKLSVSLEEIFSCKHIKAVYGRLPADSFEKLPYYDDKNFYFLPYGKDKDYCWGFYFTPITEAEETESIFQSLYFENISIPEFIHGDAESAVKQLAEDITADVQAVEDKKKALSDFAEKKREVLCKYYSKFKAMHDTFELRENVLIMRDKFYIVGFVPVSEAERFKAMFDDLNTVSVVIKPSEDSGGIETPVKLKNNAFSEPFSMFVELYGLPAYNDINPTNLVAITYTLMFGIMFGDLGQGFLVLIAGILLWKLKKMTLGRIMERLGVSSMIFGTLYGSVFGFEELLDPVYESLGIHFLPFKAMENITTVLFGAIGFGIVIILVSILINIIMGFKEKNYTRALFSNNGIAGLVFFGGLLGLVLGVVLGFNVSSPAYIIGLIVIPLLIMFFREPLGELCMGKGFKLEESPVEFIAANFFECFEFLLGYATNTLSFVRVGGFVLSHAGMMTVVLALAEMANAAASPVIMIIGNIFVIALEGLLVGIQVLRLEFYEMFSRFYTGGGKAFSPVKINYDEIID